MNSVIALQEHGQSVWLDFLARGFIAKGELKKLIDEVGLRGVTPNPSIFEKAIDSSNEYDDEIRHALQPNDCRVGDLYEKLAVEDIGHAADMLLPVYDATGSVDGYVGVGVSPYLAIETDATVAEAKRLWGEIDRKNMMIKVPATEAGLPAIRALTAEGAAQARGDFDLAQRGRRALRVHLKGNPDSGLSTLGAAVERALA